MRRITLLRHAKSDWGNPALKDFDRPLNPRGERNVVLMGQRLKDSGVRPSLILSSDAVRALSTARAIAREIGYPLEFIQPAHELYLASPATILQVLAREGRDYNDVMIVGHNPGMTDLANGLCTTQIDNMPTCGVIAVDTDIEDWTNLSNSENTLKFFDYPKNKHPIDRRR